MGGLGRPNSGSRVDRALLEPLPGPLDDVLSPRPLAVELQDALINLAGLLGVFRLELSRSSETFFDQRQVGAALLVDSLPQSLQLSAGEGDVSRPITAMRRALRAPDRVVRGAVAGTGLAMLLWLGVTMGWPVLVGHPLAALSAFYPDGEGAALLRMGFVVFAAGAALILLLAVVVSGLFYARLSGRAKA